MKDALGNVLQTAVTTNSPTTGAPGPYNSCRSRNIHRDGHGTNRTTISPNGP
ncbi:MAG: hypothetical protein IPH96_17615 [Saprospiraceae bacterium]|nr:hypothetical protein [Saprospiraceae bacterium]